MKRAIFGIVVLMAAAIISPSSWALDESTLTPTVGTSVSQEEQEFQNAMSIWLKHDYMAGEKLLKEFARVW